MGNTQGKELNEPGVLKTYPEIINKYPMFGTQVYRITEKERYDEQEAPHLNIPYHHVLFFGPLPTANTYRDVNKTYQLTSMVVLGNSQPQQTLSDVSNLEDFIIPKNPEEGKGPVNVFLDIGGKMATEEDYNLLVEKAESVYQKQEHKPFPIWRELEEEEQEKWLNSR